MRYWAMVWFAFVGSNAGTNFGLWTHTPYYAVAIYSMAGGLIGLVVAHEIPWKNRP